MRVLLFAPLLALLGCQNTATTPSSTENPSATAPSTTTSPSSAQPQAKEVLIPIAGAPWLEFHSKDGYKYTGHKVDEQKFKELLTDSLRTLNAAGKLPKEYQDIPIKFDSETLMGARGNVYDLLIEAYESAKTSDDMYLDLNKDAEYTAEYEDAVVYAGSIHFVFKIGKGNKILVVESGIYYDIEKGKRDAMYNIPSDLIDPSEDLEGVPGGNPARIGQKYKIAIKSGNISITPLSK